MNPVAILKVVGTLLVVTGSSMVLPFFWSLYYGEDDRLPILFSAVIIVALGLAVRFAVRRGNPELQIKDGLFVAFFGWIVVSAVSALPFMLHGSIPSFTDAFFEMMSGYTTTGATILQDIESVPHGLLFWRSQTHLLGGMGFLTLAIIFMPHGMGGVRLFRAESSPGQIITRERFLPRNRDAMVFLWGIYLALNALNTVFLWLGGMSPFDSLCHAFGTVSTSGYSPRNASVGHYQSAYFDWVTILFMVLGGVTFVLYYRFLKGDFRTIVRNTELRWYLILIALFSGLVSWSLWWGGTYSGILDSVRYGTFQVVSLLTTTGFTTADYELWPQAAQMLLYAVCFVGACAGSTTSGIKVVHYVILVKYLYATIRRIMLQPMAVSTIRLNGRAIESSAVELAICYFVVNIFMVLLGGCFMTFVDDLDYTSAMSSVISALMNIGPGFGSVGPSHTFEPLSDIGKWFLSWNMLVGRLEMFSALVVFYPAFWKK
ncbi:MAG: TrkH family potassium uptake protein [bacterium]|nr:TrkH family potassium uptake protein [bacterium]